MGFNSGFKGLKEKVGKDGEKNNFVVNVTLPRDSTPSRFIAFMVVGGGGP